MKIASPSDEVSIERSENRAFDRALVGGASYFGLEVRTGCATLGLFLQPQIVYTLKLLCPNVRRVFRSGWSAMKFLGKPFEKIVSTKMP